MQDLRYPIGKYEKPAIISKEQLNTWIADITSFPSRICSAVSDMSDEQLDTPYRPEGWTVRQVFHHCADSHMNAYIRLKLALTEDKPTIKPYEEQLWAELPDSSKDLSSSIKILEGTHERWAHLLNHLSEEQLQRSYIHPASGNEVGIAEFIGLYAWHGNHHLAHIMRLKERMGW